MTNRPIWADTTLLGLIFLISAASTSAALLILLAPVGGASADSIDRLIISIRERLKVTTVAVTHDMRSAGRIAQRILMLHEGRIHFTGTPEEIFKCADPVVHQFVNGISDPGKQYF